MSVGCGTIFQLGPGGQLIYLYSFSGSDGEFPYEPLVQGTDGNLYGTVNGGGAYGYGSVFKFVPGFGLTPSTAFANWRGLIALTVPVSDLSCWVPTATSME